MKFASRDFREGQEKRLKEKVFNIKMNPREWMARFGHNILAGDMRMYKYQDQEFETWIHKAFEALANEGIENLWEEFLTEEEIEKVREMYENP
ncbi:hypothetical protein [uncultured Kordia sp.]|uniref:hypothetical protein n=1 Tax=uncultured Kordia sp. TaxID=507699 RepID=UPI00262E3ED7|nr:hypothetical protein [uncultured Kordia sp.]